MEGQRLGDLHAIGRGPFQRHTQIILAGLQCEAREVAGEDGQMGGIALGRGAGRGTGQAGLHGVLIARAVVAQQAYGRGLALHQRIVQQVGADQFATAQAHVDIQHVGAHVQHGGGGGG